MNQTKITIILILFLSASCNNSVQTSNNSVIPLIDITKEYPKRDIILQDIAELSYIPLESNEDVLIDQLRTIAYLSDNIIIVKQAMKGDVFIFDGEGKIINSFNKKGQSGSEYNNLMGLCFDPINMEIFIQDSYKKKRIQVYKPNGKYVKTLKLSDSIELSRMQNFNDNLLLAYDNKNVRKWITNDGEPSLEPFLLISKKTGNIEARVDIKMKKRISTSIIETIGETNFQFKSFRYQNLPQSPKYQIIQDQAYDTIFNFTANKKLEPIVIRKPSVNNKTEQDIFVSIVSISGRYMIVKVEEKKYDFKTKTAGKSIFLLVNRSNNVVSEINLINKDFKDYTTAGNELINAAELIDALEEGRLSGKLKATAKKLTADDNPVLIRVKLKK